MESVRYVPLTPDDVGPSADEEVNTSIAHEHKLDQILLYPVPTNNILYLNNLLSFQ